MDKLFLLHGKKLFNFNKPLIFNTSRAIVGGKYILWASFLLVLGTWYVHGSKFCEIIFRVLFGSRRSQTIISKCDDYAAEQ